VEVPVLVAARDRVQNCDRRDRSGAPSGRCDIDSRWRCIRLQP
jgi:hypothetical protein